MILCIGCDLDGTLLNRENKISAYTKEILEACGRKGIDVVPVTGRPFSSVEALFHDIKNVKNFILLNGTIIQDDQGNHIYEAYLSYQQIQYILSIISRYHYESIFFSNQGIITTNATQTRSDLEKALRRNHMKEETIHEMMTIGKFGTYEKEMKDVEELKDLNIYKMEFYCESEEITNKIKQLLSQNQDLSLSSWVSQNIEITNVKGSKSKALKYYANLKGYKEDEIFVFGDSLNDLEMIKTFSNSCAMLNGMDIVKNHAKYITSYSNDEDGAARFIEHNMLKND